MSRSRNIYRIPLGFVLILALFFAAVAAAAYWYLRRSPVRAAELVIASVKGLEAAEIEETAPGRLLVKKLVCRSDGTFAAGCETVELDLDSAGLPVAIRIRGAEIARMESLLPILAGSTVAKTLPARFSAEGVFRNGPEGRSFPFTLCWEPVTAEQLQLEFSMPDPGIEATGTLDPGKRVAELKFHGRVTPELLALFGSRAPTELLFSGSIETAGAVQLDLNGLKPVRSFRGELRFADETAISGGVWAISPGTRADFHWHGPGGSWEVVLPETTLTLPFELPLGMLTVSGGERDPEIRFSIVNSPPVGELSGVMRIDGQYNRESGDWMFRQSESSDRAVRWSGELPPGFFSCIWRSPKISGGGTRSRGSIDFSLGFETLKYRAPGNPQELEAQPGTLSGSWSFDYDNPENSGFELSGLLRSSRLDWTNPESAWSATSALASFRFSRQAGEKEALLVLEPELAGINLYGGGVPKLKMEGFSGNFSTMIAPDGGGGFPLRRIEGAVEIRRVNPVRSMFGSGELKDLHLSGFAELSSGWEVARIRVSGGAENGNFRYPECEISAAEPVFTLQFDRNSLKPGDNLVGRMDSGGTTLSAFGGALMVPAAQLSWSGELRESGLLPDRWHVKFDMPAGTAETDELAGTFRSFHCDALFERSELSGFQAVLESLESRFGDVSSVWKLGAERQTLSFKRGDDGMFHGSYELSGGSIFEQQHGMDEIAITLPLTWTADGAQGEGTFRSNRVVSPGNVIRAASGKLRLAGGECSFEGCATSEFWQGEALRFSGECSRTPGWGLSGEYVLDKVVLEKPLPAAAVLPGPTVADMRFSGGVSGRGTFGFSAAGSDWSCELTAADGTLEAPGMVLKKLHGTIRLPGAGSGTRNPGGELRFGEIAAGALQVRNGMLAFRLLRPDECDVLSGSGNIWGGRVRLASPFTLRSGTESVEVGVVIRSLEWSGLLRELGVERGTIGGRADGMLFWRLYFDGRRPELVSAELTSSGSERLNLQALEPFVLASGGGARQRFYLEMLRDFHCRSLRLRFEREPAGSALLSVSATGRPAGTIKVRDDNYRRLIRSVNPAAFGLDGEIELSIDYRIPAENGDGEKP